VWVNLILAARTAGHLEAHAPAEAIGFSVSQLVHAGILDWLHGVQSLAEFETRVHFGLAMLLLGVATPDARARLQERLRQDARALERLTARHAAANPG
jgi:hypothetical protein